jgi:hypothetical protein
MATITSAGTGNWGTAGTWDVRVPLADDDVIIATGHVVTVDVARVPATAGTLTSLTGQGTGMVVINTIGHPPGCELYATTITNGAASYFIHISSNGADHVVSIIATTINAGDTATTKTIYSSSTSTAVGTINITGNINGGTNSVATCYGVHIVNASDVHLFNSTLTGGNNATAYALLYAGSGSLTLENTGTGCNIDNSTGTAAIAGVGVVYNPRSENWIKMGSTYFSPAPSKVKVLDDTSVVVSSTGAYEAGTIATRTVDNSTISQLAGYYAAFNLSTVDADLVVANIKSGVTIFGLVGESAGGGGSFASIG